MLPSFKDRIVAIDFETTGLLWYKDRAFGMAWAYLEGGKVESGYVDLREGNNLRWVRDNFHLARMLIAHNMKFDAAFARELGCKFPPRLECTMIREALLDEHAISYDLDTLSQNYLNERKSDIWPELATLFGGKPTKDVQILNLCRAPTKLVSEYAQQDAICALRIFIEQEKSIDKQDLHRIADLERRLLLVVTDMERIGVRVDLPAAERAVTQMEGEIIGSQRELNRLAGCEVNANSSPQVKKLLGVHKDDRGFWRTSDGLMLEPTESGASGALRTDKLYQCVNPIAKLVADIRGMIKARDVFLKTYILGMNHNGYIHCNINQTRSESGDAGTYTGRLSITQPALQQIHKRQKRMAAIVRSCFIPEDGHEWGCWDYNQIDFRMMAHYANDPPIIEAYKKDPKTDFHSLVAALTGLPRNRDEKTGGANAKQINLGLSFNMGAGRMAREMSLPYEVDEKGYLRAGPEAQEIFNNYHHTIPGPGRLKEQVASTAISRGHICTQLGRRLRFTTSTAYKASGILYQAAAAEVLKLKMVELHEALQAEGDMVRYLITVHDEHDLSLSKSRRAGLDDDITGLLERFDGEKTPMTLRVPILTTRGFGINWWEGSK